MKRSVPLLFPLIVSTVLTFSPGATAAANGNWIVVVPPALEKELAPLAEARRSEGWTVTVIPASSDPAAAMQQIATLAAGAQPTCVVLAGDFASGAGAGDCTVPTGKGTRLRMKDRPTDLPWSACSKTATVEVGRLPARSPEEARIMVGKILSWPGGAAAEQPFPVAGLLAGHHAAPPAFGKIADNLTNTLAARLVGRLPAAWRLEAAVHIDGSPWQVTGNDVLTAANRMMSTHSTLFAYMGHSGPMSAVSKSTPLLSVDAWRRLPAATPRPGLFFTCGCYSCQVDTARESFGLAAIRAAGGPPSVIGAHWESWSAMGYLAMSGVTARLADGPAPTRVGGFWLAVREGLEKGDINPTEFAMLDMADGTGGKVPLEEQRLEHLEMWMLLGDPAMPLVSPLPAVKINDPAAPVAGQPLTITGSLPDKFSGASLKITLERHPSVMPSDLPEVPAMSRDRQTTARERNRLATDVVLASTEIKPEAGKFTAALTMPAVLPEKPWTIRAAGPGAAGVLQIK